LGGVKGTVLFGFGDSANQVRTRRDGIRIREATVGRIP